ncbi:uncharacterized protein LOC129762801 [Toxorhynchites rutilus septentrionalis]|uniref:uncharacterized protein LOC129762801 n=1 Tax=Toxorhynchites rutilus septentrionalis TaxID=329112 RepID=UPI00247948CD|nr:uncharacterized protein LOC129762801 [Toxorhynchites rutilus septentrionalis]
MAPRRSTAKRKVNQCSYVRQLFQNFLDQNQPKHTTIPKVLPKPIQRPLQCFPIEKDGNNSLFLQQVLHNFHKTQGISNHSKTVSDFLAKPHPKPDSRRDAGGLRDACFARFKRHENTNQFVRTETSPGAPVHSLTRWIEVRKRAKIEQNLLDQQNKQKRKEEEFLNLSQDFFSGREALKLPFETASVCDRTIVSVGSKFIPPATSTPFDGDPIEFCSPIMSDPDELAQRSLLSRKENAEEFIEAVATAVEKFNAAICDSDNVPLDRNLYELQQSVQHNKPTDFGLLRNNIAERSSWIDHSFYSNANYQPAKPGVLSPLFDANNTPKFNESTRLVRTTEFKFDSSQRQIVRRPSVNPLLTASPPSPTRNMNQTLREELRGLGNKMRSKQCCKVNEFDFDFAPTEDSSFTFISQRESQCGSDFSFLDGTKMDDSIGLFPPTEREIKKYNLCSDESFLMTQKDQTNQTIGFRDIFS